MIRRVTSAIAAWFWRDLPLIGLAWALLAVQPLVPLGHPLARPDLVPWMALTLTIAAFLRARTVGEGAHPQLTPRRSGMAAFFRRIAGAAVPVVLTAWYEAGRTEAREMLIIAVGASIAAVALRWMSGEDGRTAWRPPGRPAFVLWFAVGGSVVAAAALGGRIDRSWGEGLTAGLGASMLIGGSFLGASLMHGRAVHLAQRETARRKDGKAYRPSVFKPFLAAFGPAVGLWALVQLYGLLFGAFGFEQAILGALHVVAWAMVLWAPPTPVAVAVLLHEVVPTGGAEDEGGETAATFEHPPTGALRLNPLTLRRTMAIHPWLVPVQGSRIGDLDDPIRPLWIRPPPPAPGHALGEAVFQPELGSSRVQVDTLTVRVRGQVDTSQLTSGDVQARRLVVLRPFPASPWLGRRAPTTYRWEPALHRDAVQVLDGATASLTLRDGDVLVTSTEGVARAYEVELGASVSLGHPMTLSRLPAVEDYSKGG